MRIRPAKGRLDKITGGVMVFSRRREVTGKLTAYNGAAQFEETSSVATLVSVPGTLAEQIAEASKLANKEHLPYESTITGTVDARTATKEQIGLMMTQTDAPAKEA